MDGAALVFLDETSTTTNMVRRYGWGTRGITSVKVVEIRV